MTNEKIQNLKLEITKFMATSCQISNSEYISLDSLWKNPKYFKQMVSFLIQLIELQYQDKTKFLASDKEIGDFGILPIVSVLSERLEIPMLIWKENAKPFTGESRTFGEISEKDNILIFHDVNAGSGTLLRIQQDISLKCKNTAILCLISKIEKDTSDLKNYDFISDYITQKNFFINKSGLSWMI
jgi:hypothetical protein